MELLTSSEKVSLLSARKLPYTTHVLFLTGAYFLHSCSHAGICNVLNDAVKTFKRPVYMVGPHTLDVSNLH